MLTFLGSVFLALLVVAATAVAFGWFRLSIPLRGLIHELAHGIAPRRVVPDLSLMTGDRLSAAWIGHGTLLVNHHGVRIVTDPVLFDRIGVETRFGTVGVRRLAEPALGVGELPNLDIVVVTHAHMDHFDPPSLRALAGKGSPILVVPPGLADLTAGLGYERIVDIPWNEERVVAGVTVRAFAARHWGRRTPWEKADRGYNSYLFKRMNKTLLYAGDSAYTEVFGKVAAAHGPVDAAAFNLGAYRPEWFQRSHATSAQVWEMFTQTGAPVLLPIHWGTFIISQEQVDDPIAALRGVAGERFYEAAAFRFIGEQWRSDPA